VSDQKVIKYLRETSVLYIYSNPISSGIANAALKALEILDNKEGLDLLARLKRNTQHFRKGIEGIGFETIGGIHPIVSLLIGDPARSKRITAQLYKKGIFVIALTYPVVPKGQDSIRVQISGSHTANDIDYALSAFEETISGDGKRDIGNKLKFNPIGTRYKSILPKHKVNKNLPAKMEAWVTYKGGKTLLEKIPLPDILPNDVLVETLWISICSSDINKFVDLVPGLDKTVFGHEFAGRIVAAGKNIDESIVGKIAVVEEHYPCLCCKSCKKGRYDMCLKEGFLGWYKSGNPDDWVRNGSFAEYVSIHHSCAKITEGIEMMDFFPSLAEAFGNTVKMEMKIKEICRYIPDTLVIWGGCGNQALYMVPYLAKKGVKNFILMDSDEAAILYMKKHLHDLEINLFFLKPESHEELIFLKKKLKQEDGFITLELTAEKSLQQLVLKYASPNGKIFYYGLPKKHEKVFIPGTAVDLYSFITGKSGIEKINLNGVSGVRVMGRDKQSWEKTIKVIKNDENLRKFIIDPLVLAGTTENIGELIEYLIINGSRYQQYPYGNRPAKFAVINKKMLNSKSENYG
jgi:threonine dehydrogenase-like Zn-dependent dehydrogenase